MNINQGQPKLQFRNKSREFLSVPKGFIFTKNTLNEKKKMRQREEARKGEKVGEFTVDQKKTQLK